MRLRRAGEGTSPAPLWRFPSKAGPTACFTVSGQPGDRRHVRHPGQPGRARAGARRPGAVAEMSARALTLIAGGGAGWPGDDVPSILGRPARPCRQLADYSRVSPRLLV